MRVTNLMVKKKQQLRRYLIILIILIGRRYLTMFLNTANSSQNGKTNKLNQQLNKIKNQNQKSEPNKTKQSTF